MTNSKIYLNVPYVQKDEAKSLGAKWDAINKKWFIPSELNITAFSKWLPDVSASEIPAKITTKPAKNESSSVITYPTDKNFIPYSGTEPPWDD